MLDDRDVILGMLTENRLPPSLRAYALREAYEGKGVMVALHLDPKLAKKVALKGGEAPEDLHCTLAYLGDLGDAIDAADLDKLRSVVKRVAGSHAGAISGTLGGLGRFSATPHSDGSDVVYLSVDLPELPDFRQQLAVELEKAGFPPRKDHGYTPHVTLAYIGQDDELPLRRFQPVDVSFSGVGLSIGGEREMFGFQANESVQLGESVTARGIANELMHVHKGLKLVLLGPTVTGLVILSQLVVPRGERSQGIGTEVMTALCRWADENQFTLALTPTDEWGGAVTRLKQFYRRFGFTLNSGKNKDYSISELMYRAPEEL